MPESFEGADLAFPNPDTPHDEVEVEILDIKDARGTSIKGGTTEYDPRQFAVDGETLTTIKVKVKNQEARVYLVISPADGNELAKDYYWGGKVKEFYGIVEGEHTAKWDGRGYVDGQRLILEGEYKVEIAALCQVCGQLAKDETVIKVKRPYAHAYGSVYPRSPYAQPVLDDLSEKRGRTVSWEDLTDREEELITAHALDLSSPAVHWRSELNELSDGSGFETGGATGDSASTAWSMMRQQSAVWWWNGHANAGFVVFYDDAGQRSLLQVADVERLPSGSLEDVFLVVLLGCKTADFQSTGSGNSLPGALVEKGVDVVVGFRDTVIVQAYEKFASDFLAYLDGGGSIRDGIVFAVSTAANELFRDSLQSWSYRAGGGASGNDKLIPARYGRKKI